MTDRFPARRRLLLRAGTLAAAAAVGLGGLLPTADVRAQGSNADHIVAIVNQEVVTNAELQQRLARVRTDAQRANQPLPPAAELRKQVLDVLIDERVIIGNARESGIRIEESEVDRAVAGVALQNQLSLPQLRERMRREGIDYVRFRQGLRDQLLAERSREREVLPRIRVSDVEVDALLAERQREVAARAELNIQQILVTVPEGASQPVAAERLARIEAALARVRAGEDFGAVARDVSEDGNRAAGGVIGLRQGDRLPDLFVDSVKDLQPGQFTGPVRSGAGWHVLKLLERKGADAFTTTQTRVRHVLLRPSAELSEAQAVQRLEGFKADIQGGRATFESVAEKNSQDSSAAQGGDLGWAMPGQFVPEFEEAMDALAPGGLSDPVRSRFGVHLTQVLERRPVTLDRRQQREQARNILREQKFEEVYLEWVRELRGRAYIEMREAPQV